MTLPGDDRDTAQSDHGLSPPDPDRSDHGLSPLDSDGSAHGLSPLDSDGSAHGLSHLDSDGSAHMVDVGGKPVTSRKAVATARVRCSAALIHAIRTHGLSKGDLPGVVRIAGILAAKRVDELIPLCHSLPLDQVEVEVDVEDDGIRIRTTVRTHARTGVEMEALTAASVAALTVVDMGKSVDRTMVIEDVRVLEKSGGRSGTWRASES